MEFRHALGLLPAGRRRQAPRRARVFHPLVEPLEERRVLSSADGNGPVLTAITSTPGSRSLVLTFDGPLLSSTATDLTNYRVTAPNGGNPEVVTSSGPSLRVVAAQYSDISPTSSQVTLTLARPLQPTTFYRIFINGELPITNGNPASNPLTGGGAAGNPSNGRTPPLLPAAARGRDRSQPLGSPPRLDHVGHLPGLILEFLEQLDVVGVGRPAREKQQVVGLVPPRLEPVRAE